MIISKVGFLSMNPYCVYRPTLLSFIPDFAHLVFDTVEIEMIKLIAAIDSVRGMVDVPPEEIQAIIQNKIQKGPNLVLYDGYRGIDELHRLIETANKLEVPVWVLGHGLELQAALPYAKEIHIIQMDGVFESTYEFPPFEKDFIMVKRKPIQQVNGVQFQCQVWKPDLTNLKDSWDFDIRDNF